MMTGFTAQASGAVLDFTDEDGGERSQAYYVIKAAQKREELQHAALRDDRGRAHRDAARRRLQRRGWRRRDEGPAEREGRGWEGRREEAREIKEHDVREHLPAYRRQSWEQAPLPKSMLARIYGHFSTS